MTNMTERTLDNPVVLCNPEDRRKPSLPKFTAFATRDGIEQLCLVRVRARNAGDALYKIEEDPAGYTILGIISGHHTDAWANQLGMAAAERSEARAYDPIPAAVLQA